MSAPARAELGEVTWGWWLLVLVGVLGVVAGVIILAKPGSSLPTLAVIAGIFLLVDGIFELAAAFMRGTRNRGLVALMGVLTAVIGVLLIRHPISGVAAIALLIGIWLIAVGVIRIVTAFDEPEHRGWHGLAGAVELIAGIVIVANPTSASRPWRSSSASASSSTASRSWSWASACAGSAGTPPTQPDAGRA
jgi:uncharacterized membrane protein HdeD (DUF308 family)